jgi:hypothetical protein
LKRLHLTVLALFSLAALAALSAPSLAQTRDMGVPANFFHNRPPVNEDDVRVFAELLKLLADDSVARSSIEARLAKNFNIDADRVRYACLTIAIIVILEKSPADENVWEAISRAYGPEALPHESEVQLVKPRVEALAAALNAVTRSQIEEIPWLLALYRL